MSARNAPKWFSGNPEEARRNIDSHTWILANHWLAYGITAPENATDSILCSVCGVLDGSGHESHCDDRSKPTWLNRYWLKK